MSIYQQIELNDGVVTGFLDEKIKAWHQGGIDSAELVRLGRAFNGPVPADVAARLVAWEPIIVELPGITDINGEFYTLPNRLSQFVANPNSMEIVNVAGSGYDARLHITFQELIQAVLDNNGLIASAGCLGDGAHMFVSFRAGDGQTIGGEWGGAVPLVNLTASLTGALKNTLHTSSTLIVCDNTANHSVRTATNSIGVKRTKNAASKLNVTSIREALDVAFADTLELVAEFERMANMPADEGMLSIVLNMWKPIPNDKGRAQTIAKNQHADFMRLFNTDPRNVFGKSVAGLLQTHNTWAHWEQGMRGFADVKGIVPVTARLDRMAMRTGAGDVEREDAKFMQIIASEYPELALVVAS